jgi:YgiT-type zinc finger domain-containing protein
MKCAICRNGTTSDGFTTVVLERGETTLVFKRVPAQICDNCGEEFISSSVNKSLLTHAEKEFARGISFELLNFAA